MSTQDLITEAISLPVEERVLVADSILRSLNAPESEIDAKWATVAQRRLAELRSGKAAPIAADEVFSKVWKRFGI